MIIHLKPVARNKNREQALVFSFFMAGPVGHKQCAVVASDRALGEPGLESNRPTIRSPDIARIAQRGILFERSAPTG